MKKLFLIFVVLCSFSLCCSPFRDWDQDSRKIMNFKHDHGIISVRLYNGLEMEDPYAEILIYVFAITDSIYPLVVRSWEESNYRYFSQKSSLTLRQLGVDLTIPNYNITLDTLFRRLYKWIVGLEDFALEINQQDNKLISANSHWNGALFAYNTDVLIKDTNLDVPECCRMSLKISPAFKNRIIKYTKRHHIDIGL